MLALHNFIIYFIYCTLILLQLIIELCNQYTLTLSLTQLLLVLHLQLLSQSDLLLVLPSYYY